MAKAYAQFAESFARVDQHRDDVIVWHATMAASAGDAYNKIEIDTHRFLKRSATASVSCVPGRLSK